jgi:hypothetical protein
MLAAVIVALLEGLAFLLCADHEPAVDSKVAHAQLLRGSDQLLHVQERVLTRPFKGASGRPMIRQFAIQDLVAL